MDYWTFSTESVALWIGSDRTLVKLLKSITVDDETGAKTEQAVRRIFGGQVRLSTDQVSTACLVRDQVALADVDWLKVCDEINAVGLE